MKVLLIDVNCKHSSTGKIVYDLYTELNNSGHEAAVCYGRGPLIKEKNIFKFGIDLETYFHAGMSRLTGLMGFFSIFSTLRLINYIKKFKPDVVHIHELHSYFVNYGQVIDYLKMKKIRTVWTFHCEFMYTGKCGYTYDCEKWKKECQHCPQVKEYPKSLLFDFSKFMFNYKKKLMSNFDNLTIVAPSEWLSNRVKKSFLFNKDVIVINNGIDTSIFYPKNTDILKKMLGLENEKIVLSVAPDLLSERKGGKLVLELANKLENENIKFVMIGVEKPDAINKKNVIALGRTSNQNELAEYYSLADLFFLSSKIENYPTTCIESICCGTPVLSFDVGGVKEIVQSCFGKIIKPELFRQITYNELIEISSLKSSITNSDVGILYSKERMEIQYLNLYRKLSHYE